MGGTGEIGFTKGKNQKQWTMEERWALIEIEEGCPLTETDPHCEVETRLPSRLYGLASGRAECNVKRN